MKATVIYDEENDILLINKGYSADEKFKGNIDVGEMVLDVSTRGRIRGIEIMKATEFFKDFGISKSILENMETARFDAVIKPNRIMIGVAVKAKSMENEMPAKIAVPLNAPHYH